MKFKYEVLRLGWNSPLYHCRLGKGPAGSGGQGVVRESATCPCSDEGQTSLP